MHKKSVCIWGRECVYMRVCVYMRERESVCVCVCVCECVCVCVCIQINLWIVYELVQKQLWPWPVTLKTILFYVRYLSKHGA